MTATRSQQVAHQRHGMRDEQARQLTGALQFAQQVDDLRSDRDIERADRLIEHKELRLQCQRTRNVDALSLASAEGMRIAIERRSIQPDLCQHVDQFGLKLRAAHTFAVDSEWLRKNVAYAHAAIQRGEWILEHNTHASPQMLQLRLARAQHVDAVKANTAGRRRNKAKDHACHGALAAAAFADQAKDAAARNLQTDIADHA